MACHSNARERSDITPVTGRSEEYMYFVYSFDFDMHHLGHLGVEVGALRLELRVPDYYRS